MTDTLTQAVNRLQAATEKYDVEHITNLDSAVINRAAALLESLDPDVIARKPDQESAKGLTWEFTDTRKKVIERLCRILTQDAEQQDSHPPEMTGLLPDDEYEIRAVLHALADERSTLREIVVSLCSCMEMVASSLQNRQLQAQSMDVSTLTTAAQEARAAVNWKTND